MGAARREQVALERASGGSSSPRTAPRDGANESGHAALSFRKGDEKPVQLRELFR